MYKVSTFHLRSSTTAVLIFQATISAVLGSPAGLPINNTELIEDPDDIRFQPALPEFPVHNEWKDWESWEPSLDIIKAFPYYKMGYDLDGRAVYFIDFGKWDYRQWAEQTEEKVAEFWKYFEQFVRREEKDAAKYDGMVEIVDFDGFTLSHHASPKAIKLALTMFAGKIRVDRFMTYGIFTNVNFSAEMFINSARPFLNNYVEKFEMYGTRMDKWKPLILKKISADQLAPKLGGSPDWKPVPFN